MALQGRPEDVIELWTRNGMCQIELLSGDITMLPLEEKVDIIMVSAFPGDYAPMSGTVIGALKRNLGINVMALSQQKELDLRALFSCWLSKPLEKGVAPYKKLLCFEKKRGSQMSVTAQIREMFRVFVPVFNNQDHSVITPLLATGHQGTGESVVFGSMVEAAIQWIHAGLPLRKFKIVVYGTVSEAINTIFANLKKKYLQKNEKMKHRIFKKNYDVYIAYNPVDQEYMQKIRDNLQKKKSDVKLYTETKHFNQDKVWQDGIFKVMVACKRIIAILSPAFMESTECLEQYNMAMCCNRLLGTDVLAPFYIDTISSLPSYMGLVQWIDCRVRKEGDTLDGKIQTACSNIVHAFDGDGTVSSEQNASVESTNKNTSEKFNFDVFISYSHKNPAHAEKLLATFNRIDPDCKVFYDRSSLTTGTNWQNMLYQSVGECRCFIALLSSTYISSTVCMEEYSLAMARYMSKDKDLMLIPVCIENLRNIPLHLCTKQMIKTVDDFDEISTELATSVTGWLKITATNRPSEYMIPEPVDIQGIMEAERCEEVKHQYRLVKKSREKEFERIFPLVKPEHTLEEIDTTKVDIALSYANDAIHLAGSFCILVDRLYPNLNISVHSNAGHERYSSMDLARKIVLFVSKDFLGNEHNMQELHLALNRQRMCNTKILYLIQTTPLTGRPFFPRILPYDVACIDSVWDEFQNEYFGGNRSPDKAVVTVFGKKRRLEHASTFFCKRYEYYAMTKASEDVVESLLKESNKKEVVRMLVNVNELEAKNKSKLRTETIKEKQCYQQTDADIEYQHMSTDKANDQDVSDSAVKSDIRGSECVKNGSKPTESLQQVGEKSSLKEQSKKSKNEAVPEAVSTCDSKSEQTVPALKGNSKLCVLI